MFGVLVLKMDLMKTPSPSVQSLLDSDLESVESLQYLDIEELDEVEYALPVRLDAPTLAEVLADDEEKGEGNLNKNLDEQTSSALQVDFMQAVSQQLLQAQERSSAGAATSLSVGTDGKLSVGTAHGQILSFHEQTLRWVCNLNPDRGAVSCLSYNQDSSRLLAGYARGLICQYESIRGLILRRVTLGGEIWGILQVTWAGTCGLALDTGGSVWLIKFSRPLGVRAARSSCLFSGARGEVVAMAPRDARILALATLSRVVIVAGGRAAGLRLHGPPDTLPVLAWCEGNEQILVCARAKSLQWLSVNVTGSSIFLRPIQRAELKTTPLWLGWLGGSLAIFDVDEKLRLWGDDYDKPVDLSHVETVYASAFFKGIWTDGRVSRAMCKAGASALGGACIAEGALSILGRRGIIRVRPRDLLARAQTFITTERYLQALRLLCSNTQLNETRSLVKDLIIKLSERPHVLGNKQLADLVVKMCMKYSLSEDLWYILWDHCSSKRAFVEALGDAAVRGELSIDPPSPDFTQALIERLAEFEPALVERVVASLPLTSLDPHRASVFTRSKGLWRGVGAIAAALGGSSGAMRELVSYVDAECVSRDGCCRCAGGALLLAAADALAGRGAGGRALPDHARPSARHDALVTLMADETGEGWSPLSVLVRHDARAAVRLLEQCARDPPFAGPLAKQNRLRVARALLSCVTHLHEQQERIEILEFITGQLSCAALPLDRELIKAAQDLAESTDGERADRAWLTLVTRVGRESQEKLVAARESPAIASRPRLRWRLDAILGKHQQTLPQFFEIDNPSTTDVDELFEYLHSRIESDVEAIKTHLKDHLPLLIELRPKATAALIRDFFPIAPILRSVASEKMLEFGECLLEMGRLQGDAAAAHLQNLCRIRPHNVKEFLLKNEGAVRPEDALTVVREERIRDAEPLCLEAVGDPEGALELLLILASAHEDSVIESELMTKACEMCSRVAPSMPTERAAQLWSRVVASERAPPTALVEAVAYLPPAHVIDACATARVAFTLLHCAVECAVTWRGAWECASRATCREAHESLARAMRAARRGLAVRGPCRRCGVRLDTAPTRTAHCARAFHANCSPENTCAHCGRIVPHAATPLPFRYRLYDSVQNDHNLLLLAPPRPDLEGIA